jgi:hypothetical protein
VNQIKRMESLIKVYLSMDERRRQKMEMIAKSLLNLQILSDEEKSIPRVKNKIRRFMRIG